jgi:hypothetical protein
MEPEPIEDERQSAEDIEGEIVGSMLELSGVHLCGDLEVGGSTCAV